MGGFNNYPPRTHKDKDAAKPLERHSLERQERNQVGDLFRGWTRVEGYQCYRASSTATQALTLSKQDP